MSLQLFIQLGLTYLEQIRIGHFTKRLQNEIKADNETSNILKNILHMSYTLKYKKTFLRKTKDKFKLEHNFFT
jgi:hypothetical protein